MANIIRITIIIIICANNVHCHAPSAIHDDDDVDEEDESLPVTNVYWRGSGVDSSIGFCLNCQDDQHSDSGSKQETSSLLVLLEAGESRETRNCPPIAISVQRGRQQIHFQGDCLSSRAKINLIDICARVRQQLLCFY